MKKIGLICTTVLMGLTLTACGSSPSQKSTKSSSSSSSTKAIKKHKTAKQSKKEKKKQGSISSASSSSSQSQTAAQQNEQSSTQATQTSTTKSQGEINRERGYDPNGASLLPGQDHAAGSNPDGTPDAWVQGQIDWAKQNGYLNSDGTETDKGRAADQEVEQNEQDW
ncbi:hypothetical protein [Limosilactobacillus fermentum]|uniref:hypothetical protein n=1 Tax=Limosilactobacillus fermentum TaxID=1613 RepID=UPI002110CCAF|nr:hypothetical protein [Limosilactobacillus fermentum]UUC14747.1 hypothetical protein NOV98_07045 [Limosilactobacillus fermentum]